MAMPQRDSTIEAIKRLEPPSRMRYGVSGASLEYAAMRGDEAERIRDERTGGCVGFAEGRRPRGVRPYRREGKCGIILNKEEQQWQRSWRKSLTSVRKARRCLAFLYGVGADAIKVVTWYNSLTAA